MEDKNDKYKLKEVSELIEKERFEARTKESIANENSSLEQMTNVVSDDKGEETTLENDNTLAKNEVGYHLNCGSYCLYRGGEVWVNLDIKE